MDADFGNTSHIFQKSYLRGIEPSESDDSEEDIVTKRSIETQYEMYETGQ